MWRASLAPPVANVVLAAGSAAVPHFAPIALGGFAQHGVGRAPTLSVQEACHRRIALEQTEFAACARAWNSFRMFFGPSDACTLWVVRCWGAREGVGPRFFYFTQPLLHRQCALGGCITAPFFAVPNLASAQVGARRGSAAESRGHFLASPTWIPRKRGPGGGARWGGEDPSAPFVMGRRGCGGAFVAKLLGTQGSRAARWHRRLLVSECALARSGGTTAKTRSTARHP